jgi:hypothetical protein
MHWVDWIFSLIKHLGGKIVRTPSWIAFMIGLSQGLNNGCIGLYVKNIDLNGADGNV